MSLRVRRSWSARSSSDSSPNSPSFRRKWPKPAETNHSATSKERRPTGFQRTAASACKRGGGEKGIGRVEGLSRFEDSVP